MSTVSNSTLASRFRNLLGANAASCVNRPVDLEVVRILVLGDSDVKKSQFVNRFCGPTVDGHPFQTTIGVDFRLKKVDVLGKPKKLQIWDTAGQERFRTITTAYYRGAHAAILLYDVGNRQSFDNLRRWINDLSMRGPDNLKMILIGKCANPQNRTVTPEEGKALAVEFSMPFLECAEDFDDSFSSSLQQVLFQKEFDEPLIARGAAIVDALTSDRTEVISHWFKKDEVIVHPPMLIKDLAKIVASYDEESKV